MASEAFDASSSHSSAEDIFEFLEKIYLEVPRDEQDNRFIKSFDLKQSEEFKKFFDHFGFVVIRDVLTPEECKRSINDIWNYIETQGWKKPVGSKSFFGSSSSEKQQLLLPKRDDPSTWSSGWPSMEAEGILGVPSVFTSETFSVRQNENIYKAHSILLSNQELMVNHDRYGLFRPTIDPNTGKVNQSFATWRNLHLDANPWNHIKTPTPADITRSRAILENLSYDKVSDFITENNEIGFLSEGQLNLQALVNFQDNFPEDGGFHIVPGMPQKFVEWTNSREKLKQRYGGSTFVVLPQEEPIQKLALRISMRQGALLIWDQRSAHGSAPNSSKSARYCQFLKVSNALHPNSERATARRKALQKKLKNCDFDKKLTPLGKCLFGLEPWGKQLLL